MSAGPIGEEVARAQLLASMTQAIERSGLPWPVFGSVMAEVLDGLLGNDASVCVREPPGDDGRRILNEFDAKRRISERVEPEPLWRNLRAYGRE